MGAGPGTFDSAFSEGDWLVLAKDGRRVIVFSLSTGRQIAEEPGYDPAISAGDGLAKPHHRWRASGSLRFENGGPKVRSCDFPQEIAYSHFSADGKRLLVMT